MKKSQAFVFETEAMGRQVLVANIDMGIIMHGPRVRAGVYQISIRRIGKGEPLCLNCGMHHTEDTQCPGE